MAAIEQGYAVDLEPANEYVEQIRGYVVFEDENVQEDEGRQGYEAEQPEPRAEQGNPVEQGYEPERFENVVSKNYHCVICFNVFKDPVMCRNNEHLFCRACITRHLKKTKKCPTCLDYLTVDTLRDVPRIVTGCLSEFKIRCEFFERGCQFVALGDLERHVKDCGYAPAVCSNKGCDLEVNKRDLIYHETEACEQRRVKCHNCGEMRRELNKVNEKLDKMEAKYDAKFTALNDTLKEVNGSLAAQNEKLTRLEALEATCRSLKRELQSNRQIKDNVQMTETETKESSQCTPLALLVDKTPYCPENYDINLLDESSIGIKTQEMSQTNTQVCNETQQTEENSGYESYFYKKSAEHVRDKKCTSRKKRY